MDFQGEDKQQTRSQLPTEMDAAFVLALSSSFSAKTFPSFSPPAATHHLREAVVRRAARVVRPLVACSMSEMVAGEEKSSRSFIDIGANLLDDVFRGSYHGTQRHESDFDAMLERASAAGVGKAG